MRGEIEAAEMHTLPRLVDRADLHGDLHMHTTETDGKDDIRTMAAGILRGPVNISVSPPNVTASKIKQWVVTVDKRNKPDLFMHLVAENNWELAGGGHSSPAKNLQISPANTRCENSHMCFVAEQRPQVPFDKSDRARFGPFESENLLALRKI